MYLLGLQRQGGRLLDDESDRSKDLSFTLLSNPKPTPFCADGPGLLAVLPRSACWASRDLLGQDLFIEPCR